MLTMCKQDQEVIVSNRQVKIPETKRFYYANQTFINGTSNTINFSQANFQSFRNQLQEIKHELTLKPQRSGFTRVSYIDDDEAENFKTDSTLNKFSNQDSQKYKVQFNKLLQYLSKQGNQSSKQLKQPGLNTKNILRNICNAQNQFILFNSEAKKIIEVYIQNSSKFKIWVNKLRFHTFQEFQSAWENTKSNKIFSKVYKKLCRKFYKQNAIPYVMNSRIKNKETKLAHIRYLYRFLEGIQNPAQFYYFKQKDKDKMT